MSACLRGMLQPNPNQSLCYFLSKKLIWINYEMNFMQEKVSWFQGLYSALIYENKPRAGCAYGGLGTCCFRDEWEEDVAIASSVIIVAHLINGPPGPGKTALTCGFVESGE